MAPNLKCGHPLRVNPKYLFSPLPSRPDFPPFPLAYRVPCIQTIRSADPAPDLDCRPARCQPAGATPNTPGPPIRARGTDPVTADGMAAPARPLAAPPGEPVRRNAT